MKKYIKNSKVKIIRIINKTTVVITCSFYLLSCSQQAPDVNYQGIDDHGALELLQRAESGQEVKTALYLVSQNSRAGFDWLNFWTQILERGLFHKFQAEVVEDLILLASRECSTGSLSAFVRVFLAMDVSLYPVLGESRSCRTALSLPVAQEVWSKLMRSPWSSETVEFSSEWPRLALVPMGPDEDARTLADFIILELNLNPGLPWQEWFGQMPTDQWVGLLKKMILEGQPEKMISLLEVYQQVRGAGALINQLMVPLLRHSETFQVWSRKMTVYQLLQLMRLTALSREDILNSSEWLDRFRTLQKRMEEEWSEQKLEARNVQDILAQTHMLLVTLDSLSAQISYFHQLTLLEKTLRFLENQFKEDVETARRSINLRSPGILELWINFRIKESFSTFEALYLDTLSPQNFLEEALYRQLRLYQTQKELVQNELAQNASQLREEAEAHCRWLELKGVPSRKMTWPYFWWVMMREPGCIYLEGSLPEESVLMEEVYAVEKSFSTILFMEEINRIFY